MKTISIGSKVVKLYDSIDEMPIVNYQKYNKYLLIDAGIGSDIEAIDEHIVNLAKLINTDLKKANQELQNLHQSLYMVSSQISPLYMAFAALIYSIDGEVISDFSDDNLKRIIASLKEAKHSVLNNFIAWIKKKLCSEIEVFFPSEFSNIKDNAIYDKLKQRALLILQWIENDKDTSEEVAKIDAYLFSLHNPKSFQGASSIEVKYEKQFETLCLLISQKTGMNAKKMTVLEFYNALSNIEKQNKLEAKAYSKKR